ALHAPQSRQRLGRVEDAGLAARRPHVATRQRRDAREMTQEVECDALAAENGSQRPADLAELGADVDGVAVVDAPGDVQLTVDLAVGLVDESGAGEHTFFTSDEERGCRFVLTN